MTLQKHAVAKALADRINALLEREEYCADGLAQMLEYPPNGEMGDVALPCFKLAKAFRRPPAAIAEAICDGFSISGISKIESVNGYLNFFIDRAYAANKIIGEVLERKEKYGASNEGEGKTVVLDYSSPNVAKPFHIGHLGTTVIGHSLKKLFAFNGYNCVGINYLGDWGTQFGKLIVAYRKYGSKEMVEKDGIDALVALYVRFHKEAEADPKLEDEARAEFTKLEHGDAENTALWKWFIDISIAEYQKTYRQLGIDFDSWKGESFYSDKMPAVVEELKEKKLMKIDDGASIIDLSAYNMPPCLILKRDGSSLYPTRDIAAALYRKNHYHFDRAVYVTSAGQCLHFAQWFKVVELMGYDWAKDLIHVPYGNVSLNGENWATRTGNVILLRDLFDLAIEKVSAVINEKNPDLENKEQIAEDVGVGAVVFYYLSNNRMKDINFVMDDALSFDGNTGPYVQYTYARTCSVLSKSGCGEDDIKKFASEKADISDDEYEVIKALSMYPERVASALAELEPSLITRYILDLATAYNRFYHNEKILTAENEEQKNFRIALTAATKYVLGSAFELICLKKTEKI